MNKTQLKKEKQTVEEMKAEYEKLSRKDKEELLRLRCRTEFITYARFITDGIFIPYPVHKVICDFIQLVADGNHSHKRSVISLPPRSGKSFLFSKVFPSWQMGRNPIAQFIMCSYAMSLSTENSRAVLNYLISEKFKWVFPECDVNRENCNLSAIRTSKGGIIKVASAGGNVTGFGFGTIPDDELPGVGLLDDLLADGNSATVMDSTFEWVQTQFLTRALPNNSIISMGTRFHPDDVTGRLITASPEDWKILNVPAICVDEETDPLGRKIGESHWPEFFTVEDLGVIRRNIGEKDFISLYQGRPSIEGGSIFKDVWIELHDSAPEKLSYIFATMDTAYKEKNSTNDYTAMCIWGYSKKFQKIYLLDYYLDRVDFPDLSKLVTNMVSKWKIRTVYIEGAASGGPLIQTLKRIMRISIKELKPNKDKILRANSVAPLVEMGALSLYENLKDINDRINELTGFPYIKHDDFVDAVVYGLIVARDELGLKPKVDLSSFPMEIIEKTRNIEEAYKLEHGTKIIGHKPKDIPTRTQRVSSINTDISRKSGLKYM